MKVSLPKLTNPVPFVSKSWKAVTYRASGRQSNPSKAWNSGNEMSLSFAEDHRQSLNTWHILQKEFA